MAGCRKKSCLVTAAAESAVIVGAGMSLSADCSNFSGETLTVELWDLDDQLRDLTLSIGVVVTIYILLGILLNLVVIGIILKKRLFKQPAVLLLLNLTVTNFLMCVLVLPFNAISALAGGFIFGNSDRVRCEICKTGNLFTAMLLVSVYSVTLLSVDRFLYVKRPMKYDRIVTMKRVVVILVSFWVVFVAFSLLPFLDVGVVFFSRPLSLCTLVTDYNKVNTAFVYVWVLIGAVCILPSVVLVVTNIWMLWIMARTVSNKFNRQVSNISGGESRSSFYSILTKLKAKYKSSQFRLLQVFGAIFGINIITWLPTVVSISLVSANVISLEYLVFAHLSLLSQVVLHPVIQVFLYKDIRVVFINMCKRRSRG